MNFRDRTLGVLPPVVHIRKVEARAAMQWYLERMMKVIREPQPGGLLPGEHLAQMMLIEVLGLYLAEPLEPCENPGYRWTLQELAEHVGMSRSALALRFKQKALTRWRMLRAGEMLIHSRDPVSTVALSLGYESENAFSFAFKREMGRSPRQFSREQASGLARPVSACFSTFR